MARIKKYKYVIIVDENNRPMAWDELGKQLAYCTNDRWEDEHHPVVFYTILKAKKLIAKSTINKRINNLSPIKYFTMPFDLNYRQELELKKFRKNT